MHDVVAHHVSLIAVQAAPRASLLPGDPERAADSVEAIGSTARQALTELRRLLGVLRGPGEPLPVAPAVSIGRLDALVEDVRHTCIPVSLSVTGSPRRLPPTVDLTAYRIVHEALTHSVRHAPR